MSPASDSRRRRHSLAALESRYARDLGRRNRGSSRVARDSSSELLAQPVEAVAQLSELEIQQRRPEGADGVRWSD
jgi:hypothetical protein